MHITTHSCSNWLFIGHFKNLCAHDDVDNPSYLTVTYQKTTNVKIETIDITVMPITT